MWVLDGILNLVNNIALFFYKAYLEVKDWWFPFHLLQYPFYDIFETLGRLLFFLMDFKNLIEQIVEITKHILSEGDIWDIFSLPLTWAQLAWDWVANAWKNIWDEVETWWETKFPFVKGLIDTAIQVLTGEISFVAAIANTALSSIKYFFTTILPTLAPISIVHNLIDSTLREWFPWYDALAQSMEGILTFFTDPAKAVYELFDYIIDRFWEDTT